MLLMGEGLTSSERGTGTVVVSKGMFMRNRERSGTKAAFPRRMGVRMHKRILPCIDHKNLGLRGTVGRFRIAMSKGIYASIKSSANKFASYVLRGKTGGMFTVSIKEKRLS